MQRSSSSDLDSATLLCCRSVVVYENILCYDDVNIFCSTIEILHVDDNEVDLSRLISFINELEGILWKKLPADI